MPSARHLAPVGLAMTLFAINSLTVIGGWVDPPVGYAPAFQIRGADIAKYHSWVAGFDHGWTIPNYQAPWATEAALFNALPFVISRTARLFGLDPLVCYHLLHALLYGVAVFALFYAVRVFLESRSERRWVWIVILLSVPATSLLLVPFWLAKQAGIQLRAMPGVGDFVFWTSDGLFHGIAGSIYVTFGTATVLLAFACLARYLQTGRVRFLAATCITTWLSAFVHPFEAVVICTAGGLTLVTVRWQQWAKLAGELGLLGAAGALGVLPLLLATIDTAWLRAAADVNRWQPPNIGRLLLALGIPSMLALVFLIATPRLRAKSDVLLQLWFLSVLAIVYLPWMPWSQHAMNGVLYGAAILVVRQSGALARRFHESRPRLTQTLLAVVLLASLVPAVVFRWQSFVDGKSAEPEFLFSGVTLTDEQGVIAWLTKNAHRDQLVMAPPEHAPWMATVPIHSFASHFVFSLTYDEQTRLAERFFGGQLPGDEADNVLRRYGVRYLVVPTTSGAMNYVRERAPRTQIGSLQIYEFPEYSMQPYRAGDGE